MHSAIELQSPTLNAHFYHKISWNAPLAPVTIRMTKHKTHEAQNNTSQIYLP